MSTSTAQRFSPDAGDAKDWRSALGRIGLGAHGMLYLVLGFLALQFAIGNGSSAQISNRGAVQFVKSQPFGTVLLWALALGLAAMALWQLVLAVTGDPVKGSEPSDRAMYALMGVLYGAIAVTAFAALGASSGSGGGSGGQAKATAFLLGLPYGQWITAVIGVGVIAYAAQTIWNHALHARFMQRISTHQMDPATSDAVRKAGQAGYGARGVTIGIIGIFIIVAAVQHSADSTRGLAGSLLALSQQSYGPWLLGAVAIGLMGFGVFSLVEARYRVAA